MFNGHTHFLDLTRHLSEQNIIVKLTVVKLLRDEYLLNLSIDLTTHCIDIKKCLLCLFIIVEI